MQTLKIFLSYWTLNWWTTYLEIVFSFSPFTYCVLQHLCYSSHQGLESVLTFLLSVPWFISLNQCPDDELKIKWRLRANDFSHDQWIRFKSYPLFHNFKHFEGRLKSRAVRLVMSGKNWLIEVKSFELVLTAVIWIWSIFSKFTMLMEIKRELKQSKYWTYIFGWTEAISKEC